MGLIQCPAQSMQLLTVGLDIVPRVWQVKRSSEHTAGIDRVSSAPQNVAPKVELYDSGEHSFSKQNGLGSEATFLAANHRPEGIIGSDHNPLGLRANFLKQKDVKLCVKVHDGVEILAGNVPRGPIDLTWRCASGGSIDVAIELALHGHKVESEDLCNQLDINPSRGHGG